MKIKFLVNSNAKKISESCNLDSENMLKDQEVENFMFDVLRAEYEPFSSLRILSQHHLYKKFKDEIRVVIDGSWRRNWSRLYLSRTSMVP